MRVQQLSPPQMIKLTTSPVLYTYDLTDNSGSDLAAELIEYLLKVQQSPWALHDAKQILIHVGPAQEAEREGNSEATELMGILSKYIEDSFVTVDYILLTFLTP